MGAQGMNMGTRFIATKEAPVHENVKRAIVEASELDTRLVMRPLRNTERVMNNAAVERLLEKEKELGDAITIQDILPEVAGVYPSIMMEGEMDKGARHGRRPHQRCPDLQGVDRRDHEPGRGDPRADERDVRCLNAHDW